jgi:hypothetical protein
MLILAVTLFVTPLARCTSVAPRPLAYFDADTIAREGLLVPDGVSATLEEVEDDTGERLSTVRIEYTGEDTVFVPLWAVDLEPYHKGTFNFYSRTRTRHTDGEMIPEMICLFTDGTRRRLEERAGPGQSPDYESSFRVRVTKMRVGWFEQPDYVVLGYRMSGPGTLWIAWGQLNWRDERFTIRLWGACVCVIFVMALWRLGATRLLAHRVFRPVGVVLFLFLEGLFIVSSVFGIGAFLVLPHDGSSFLTPVLVTGIAGLALVHSTRAKVRKVAPRLLGPLRLRRTLGKTTDNPD